jgi:hypothetical protein
MALKDFMQEISNIGPTTSSAIRSHLRKLQGFLIDENRPHMLQ